MSQSKTVGPGHLAPLAPVGMPPSGLHLLDVASPPTHHGRRLRALVVAMALRGGGEERLGTRLGKGCRAPTGQNSTTLWVVLNILERILRNRAESAPSTRPKV